MIGIIGAMQIEVETIRSKMENKVSRTVSDMEFVSGTYEGKETVTAVCGIGKVAAAMCAEAMILTYLPELIVNTGVGGTLTPELSVGDVAIAENVCQHDMDTTPIGDPPGFISGPNIVKMPTDEKTVNALMSCAEGLGLKAVKGTIASGDQFIHSKEQKEHIVSLFGGIACEMEGAAIGHVCYVNKVPFAVVRAISDCADGESPMTYAEFLPIAADNAAKMLDYILKNN